MVIVSGDEPGVPGTGSLRVHPVALVGLVPVDEPLPLVADALRGALLPVVLEEESLLARSPGVPLVATPVLRPEVLVVARGAAALAAVGLAGILLEHHQLPQSAGTAAADLQVRERERAALLHLCQCAETNLLFLTLWQRTESLPDPGSGK